MTTTILTLLILIIFSTVAQATEPQDSTGNCGATNELETDSVKTNLLNEIVVRGESVRFEDGKIIFTPSKQSKNLAKDIPGLIGLMNTGVLHVVTGKLPPGEVKKSQYTLMGRSPIDLKMQHFGLIMY